MVLTPTIGSQVRILPPFDESFPSLYVVEDVITQADGQVACILSDGIGGFDPKFLMIEVTE